MQVKLNSLNLILQKYQKPIKFLIFIAILVSIYLMMKQKGENLNTIQKQWQGIFLGKNRILLILIILLSPVNWAFEALKWQFLAEKIEHLSFKEAYKSVLAGLAFATTTPFMLGDYAAKIWLLKTNRRTETVGAILLGNGIQLYVSLLFGTISYIFFIKQQHPKPLYFHIFFVSILFLALILGIFLGNQQTKITYYLKKISFLNPYIKTISIIEKYKISDIKRVLILAILRYIIFSFQFVLMLWVFQINLPIQILFCGVSLIFLAKTIIPFLNFVSDFGIRQMASFYYFSFFSVSLSAIASATTLIWLINILLPMLIGASYVFKFRLTLKP